MIDIVAQRQMIKNWKTKTEYSNLFISFMRFEILAGAFFWFIIIFV